MSVTVRVPRVCAGVVALMSTAVVLSGSQLELAGQQLPTSEDCVNCHQALGPRLAEPARSFSVDVHAESGFGCLDCHGGAATSMDPHAGFLTAPERSEIPALCGRCHSDAEFMRQYDPGLRVDQVTEYWSSTHGTALRERNDSNVATCVDCHPAHRIRAPEDLESSVNPRNVVQTCGRCHADAELMTPYGISADQVEEYTEGVHGRLLLMEGDVSAPACNDCHGNHGAAPPGVSSVRNVCGQCHAMMADYFSESGHQQIFELVGLPGCATCHEHHAIEPATDAKLNTVSATVCVQCHQSDDPRGDSFAEMALLLDSLHLMAARSRDILLEAEDRGMEVGQMLFELDEINSVLNRARGAVHTFNVAPVEEATDGGQELALRGIEEGRAALEEFRFRRVGLGLSSGIIIVLIFALIMKIRAMDRKAEDVRGAISTFFANSLATPAGSAGDQELRLAASAVLLEAVYVAEGFSEQVRQHVVELIKGPFGLPPGQAGGLIELAELQRTTPAETGGIARMIANNFTSEQRRGLMEELWALVFSDRALMVRDLAILEAVSDLMGLDPEEVSAARVAASTDRSGPARAD